MKKLFFVLLVTFTAVIFSQVNAQCNEKKESAEATVKCDKIVLCGHCGEVKGSENCCKADAVKCEKCRLNLGSPGCCKMEAGTDVVLCPKCGEIAGSEKCCNPEAVKCEKCGKHEGSPGCCIKEKDKV